MFFKPKHLLWVSNNLNEWNKLVQNFLCFLLLKLTSPPPFFRFLILLWNFGANLALNLLWSSFRVGTCSSNAIVIFTLFESFRASSSPKFDCMISTAFSAKSFVSMAIHPITLFITVFKNLLIAYHLLEIMM